ncbi:KTSC domain-containing protein [uncultured Anaerovibrio sp.]|uniref:KTSC domain-containing protein n=1 Tax=uncultured Anaerovibrio sp. TaxID=361586 RepID=UPI0026257ECA|nr:KTSC domain-containing protein [uncultured Anaerovibrio sp.]
MNLSFVVSSNVSAIGYQDGILEVHFKNGSVYQYLNTSQRLFNEFLIAPSKGHFVHQRLKDKYPTRRIQ